MDIQVICAVVGALVGLMTLVGNIFLYVKTYNQTERINHSNSMAKYFNEIFDRFLIEEIPNSRAYIRFEGETLKDFRQLTDTLNDMMKKALYFKYSNPEFYKKLRKKVTEFEDYLADCGNHRYDQDDQSEIFKEIGKKIEEIYACINEAYI